MTAQTTSKPLPAREAQMMKLVLKLHENKQYKKGLKTADQILKKFPEHAEAVAMKALFMSSMDRAEEAHELVKKAIKMQISNGVCWHVYGLIHRAEKNYEEALKCYTMALKFDKDNIQIFRDHSMLQVQTRNYDGFIDSNMALVLQKPGYKAYWLSLVVSFHLIKNYAGALETLSSYHDIFQTFVEPNSAYENSEVYLYKNMVIEESGDFAAALEDLNQIENKVVDKKAWKEAKARLLLKSGEIKKAEIIYKVLLRQNPDCLAYVEALMSCKGLNSEDSDKSQLFEFFEDLRDQFKRAHIIRRLPLNFAHGERFKLMVNNYLRPMFRKGVPSVFVSIKDLYKGSPSNQSAVESIVLEYEKNLASSGHFSAEDAVVDEDGGSLPKEPPSALLWVLYFLAQHFDHLRDGAKAVEYIDRAIDHTPTLVELLMTKARILKHAGDLEAAKVVMNEARERDLQDRYINSKCSKYMIRNDNVEEAEKTIVMFVRNDSADKLGELVDLQCTWFALECGKSFARKGRIGKALKKFHQIEKHFNDIYDDQFDFHNYSFRKMTIRTYVDLLRLEDRLRDHPIFFRAAVEAVRLYIKLFDKPRDDEQEKENINESDLSESEKKKAIRKARKADLASSAGALQANGSTANGSADKSSGDRPGNSGNPPPQGSGKKVDDDPEGLKLAATAEPLVVALRFLKPLLELSPGRVETHVLASAVFLRKKKMLLTFRSLKKGLQIAPDHPDLHKTAVQFWNEFEAQAETMNATVRSVIKQDLSSVYGSSASSMESFNASFLVRNRTALMHVAAATEVSVSLDRSRRKEAALRLAEDMDVSKWTDMTLDNLIAVYNLLASMSALGCPDAASAFATKAGMLFPLSSFFQRINTPVV